MSDHAWVHEHAAAYLADGLDAAEAERFDAHVAACEACAAVVADARTADRTLSGLFAGVRPGPTLEDRLIRSLRGAAEPRSSSLLKRSGTWKRKIAWGLAASVGFGLVGATGLALVQNGGLPFPGQSWEVAEAVPIKLVEGGWDDNGSMVSGGEADPLSGRRGYSTIRPEDTVGKLSDDYGRVGQRALNGTGPWRETAGGIGGGFQGGGFGGGGIGGGGIGGFGGGIQGGFGGGGFQGGGGGGYRNSPAAASGKREPGPNLTEETTGFDPNTIPAIDADKLDETAKKFVQNDVRNRLHSYERDAREAETKLRAATQARLESETERSKVMELPAPTGATAVNGNPVQRPAEGVYTVKPVAPTPVVPTTVAPATAPTPAPVTLNYFKPGDAKYTDPAEEAGKNQPKAEQSQSPEAKPKGDAGKGEGKKSEPRDDKEGDKGEKGGQAKPDPGKPNPGRIPGADGQTPPAGDPAPAPARKIIIRSGEIEYEIESFDSAVAAITKLTLPIKGAFVATVNSDKLPNGKVKGTIVVRIPPEHLDGFVLDIRKELSRGGELKGQKIGSTDITKMYTDMESRLRAARTMETRLIEIIKSGKGEIKDLLAAEKELGVWRTKIEELEGEIRYYGNLASLSTLTITLAEKEIRAAAGATESEVVQTGIEVEDVDMAFREATKAVLDAKGRITKSELKQYAAGQFNATLNFEVAPEQSGPLRDRLRQLGRVARLEINRVQQAEGGPPTKDAKITRGDTQFLVQFYNLANIAPRESAVLQLAVADVPTAYRSIRDAVEKAKGRVVAANLNESDRANVNAQLDFEVKRTEEGPVQAALSAAGEVTSRTVTRAPEGDNVTDTKVLIRATLFSASKLAARDTTTVQVAVPDVPTAYRLIRDAVEKAKGRVVAANLNESDRANVNAQIDFEVKRTEEATVLGAVGMSGDVVSRQTARAPETAMVTDAKVLIRMSLFSASKLAPRETTTVHVAVIDIPSSYRAVFDAVEKAKGRIVTANLNEGDRQSVTAQLDFEVKRADEATVLGAVGMSGDVVSRQTARAPETAMVTDAKVLIRMTFLNAARLKPRETVLLGIEVDNVDTTAAAFNAHVAEAKGRVLDSNVHHERDGRVTARLVYDVPLASAASVVERFKAAGAVRVQQSARDPQATDGKFATARIDVTLANADLIVSPGDGVWDQVRKGLSVSLTALLKSLSWLIFGLLVVLPWALLVYAGYKVVRWVIRKPAMATVPATPAAT